jgi:hypothetical protein
VTLKDVFINSYKKFANNPALGIFFFYSGTIIRKENKASIEYLSYREAIDRAKHTGGAIINRKLFNNPKG